MSRILMIGAGGVATVAAFKIAQNADVFTDFMIASRRKEKCDKIVEDETLETESETTMRTCSVLTCVEIPPHILHRDMALIDFCLLFFTEIFPEFPEDDVLNHIPVLN